MTIRQLIIGGLLSLATLAVPLQVIIDPSMQNVASACVVLASSGGILLYIGWTRAMEVQPLSTFAIFGFCATTQLGALLAQTAAWTALGSSLYDPLYTFGVLAGFQAIAIAVHALYSFVLARESPRPGPVRSLLEWAGLYRTPPASVLWTMGILGLTSFAFYGGKDVLSKAVAAFNFLTWAPFLIPIYLGEAGKAYCNTRRMMPQLGLYTLAVALLGIAVNARGILFFGFVTIGLCYMLIGMRSTAPARLSPRAALTVATLAVIALALAGPMSDMATAMAIAREHRGKVSPLQMIQYTFDAWQSPYLISQYRAWDKSMTATAYDESYIANPMVARFVETKFHDNSLHFAGLLSTEDSQARLRNVTVANLWAILPAPILSALHVSVNKAELNFSVGDYLFYLGRGVRLGGHKTGSVFAEGMVLLGPLFPFLYALILLVTYAVMDLLTVRPERGPPMTSALARMLAWPLFLYGVTGEAIHAMVLVAVREVWQSMMIYLLVLACAGLVLRSHAAPRGESQVTPGTS